MALDKWQEREVAQYAKDNDVSEEAALKELHPDEVPAARARRGVVKETPTAP
jgi:hypothetical protein